MERIRGKVIAITGASSGIGEATARLLGERGARLVLGARRVARLEAVTAAIRQAGGEARLQALDVTRRAEVAAFVDAAVAAHGRLDVLINNAGVMPLSYFEQLHVDEWERMIDVNIKGVLYGIAAALPVMKRQGSGHIINVSSVADRNVRPAGGIYSATKHAVRALTEGLRQESGAQLRATLVSPGVTESELADSITVPEIKKLVAEYRKAIIPAAAIARAIAFAIEQPDDVDVNELVVRPTAQTY